MENNEEIKKEDKLDIKAVFSKLVDEEPEILSQEEAIKTFGEEVKKRKNIGGTNTDSDDSNKEEEEHLKRIKQELLASLKRVEELSKKIFVDKEIKAKHVNKMVSKENAVSKENNYNNRNDENKEVEEKTRE